MGIVCVAMRLRHSCKPGSLLKGVALLALQATHVSIGEFSDEHESTSALIECSCLHERPKAQVYSPL